MPILYKLNQQATFFRECKCIIPFYSQERIGIKVDMKYLNKSIEALRYEYRLKDAELQFIYLPYASYGTEYLSAGQHQLIKKLLQKV
ncbi:MAG: hypothetical protein ACRCXT_01685 [Paraclostridium sp.]